MKNVKKQAEVSNVCDLQSKHMLMAGDDPAEYEAFRAALLPDLAPGTAYERIVANDLVALEWESRRMRVWLVALQKRAAENRVGRAEMRNPMLMQSIDVTKGSPAEDWVYGPEEKRGKAEAVLRHFMPDLMAKVADSSIEGPMAIRVLESMIEVNQGRRRRLLADYRSLQSQRRAPVAEAEIVED